MPGVQQVKYVYYKDIQMMIVHNKAYASIDSNITFIYLFTTQLPARDLFWSQYVKDSIFLKNDFIIQERFNKLIYGINTIIKCGI